MQNNTTVNDLCNKYPTKRGLYDFLALTYFLPKFTSSIITIEFQTNLSNKNFVTLRITHDQISGIPKYKKHSDRRSIYPVNVIQWKIHKFLKSLGQPGLCGFNGSCNYSWLDRVTRYLDPKDDSLKIYCNNELQNMMKNHEIEQRQKL